MATTEPQTTWFPEEPWTWVHCAVIHYPDAPITIDVASARALAPELYKALRQKVCGVECACCRDAKRLLAKVEGR